MSATYHDDLVDLTDAEMVFHRYYFPFCTEKRVNLNRIQSIEAREPSLMNGRWRIWGTGDFRTWFPLDGGRPGRERIFIASLRGSSMRIGFTVKDSAKFESALKERGLL